MVLSITLRIARISLFRCFLTERKNSLNSCYHVDRTTERERKDQFLYQIYVLSLLEQRFDFCTENFCFSLLHRSSKINYNVCIVRNFETFESSLEKGKQTPYNLVPGNPIFHGL
jgi:hypothetical protein